MLGLAAALVVVLACGVGGRGAGGGNQPYGAGTSTRSGTATPPGEDEDGTMTAEEFQKDAQGAIRLAERYWDEQLRSRGRSFQPIRRVTTYTREGQISCGNQRVPRNNAVYCPAGDFIAYDVNWAAAEFRQIGDAFLFYLLGHEYAHGIQVRLGIRYNFTIQQELQADCMAGAYIGDSVREKVLTLQDGDIDELRRGLIEVGDDPGQPWFAEGAHGDAEQRSNFFFAGYQRSLAGCDLN
ncbi:neutral zinc metallopeptidase [Micromonospora zhanjiangensis]